MGPATGSRNVGTGFRSSGDGQGCRMADENEMPDPSVVTPRSYEEEPSITGVVADDDAAEVDDDGEGADGG